MRWAILIVGILLFCILRNGYCQVDNDEAGDEDDTPQTERPVLETQEEEREQTEAEGVTTACIFPNHVLKQFPAGEVIEALIGFKNQNENAFHVEYIRGSLTSPVDFTYYIYNFTGAMHNATIATGEEASLIYRFKSDASIEPRQYGHILQVFYTNDDNETYLSTVFNSTIEITDPANNVDGKTVFAYLSIFGMIGFGGFLLFKWIMKRWGKKSTKATKAAASAEAKQHTSERDIRNSPDWDYIKEEYEKLQAFKRRRSGSPNNTSPQKSRNSPVRKR